MKIFVISNTSDKTRSENILKQFASQNTRHDYEIVEAVMNSLQPCRGISQSFKKCIQIAKKGWYPEVMVLEDDFLALHPDSILKLMKLWNKYALNDGILLGSVYEGTLSYLDEGVSQVEDKFSALNSVIIPENLYDTILQSEEAYHLDYYLGMVAKVPIYVADPFLIIQNDGYSYNLKKNTDYNKTLHLKYRLIKN